MRTIRWGIIGCGDVCEVKSGPAFQKAEHSALAAVMRRDGDKARDFARRHGVPRWYDDAEALVADPEVDAVYVATPPAFHKPYCLLAARAGKPVYVEKPMALDHAECLAMLDACRAAGVPLFVAYYRRSLPRFRKVKELLEADAIGEVRSVTVTLARPAAAAAPDPAKRPWRVVPALAGGGLFADLACHTLDLLDFLLGPVAEAKGLTANQAGLHGAEDAVAAAFAFASGALGSGAWSFSAQGSRDRVEIEGSRGRIGFSTFEEEPVVCAGPAGRQEFRLDHPPHIQQPHIQSIVGELNGQGHCPSPGASAARTSRVMDAILRGG